ncbi:MAG TPA: hypothetical protein VJ697_13650 [Nitrososphaeraceae archaeon]|nr:hypothetical protein [Nitrososphaeraceae archaeon]
MVMLQTLLVFLTFLLYLPFLSVFGVPEGTISPGCAPIDEFEMQFSVNGFFPNYYTSWDFLDPDNNRVMHGYFATNSTGGFTEDAELEAFVPGEHTLILYDDLEHDSIVDKKGNIEKISIKIPCS